MQVKNYAWQPEAGAIHNRVLLWKKMWILGGKPAANLQLLLLPTGIPI